MSEKSQIIEQPLDMKWRQLLVETLFLSVEYWEATTLKTRLELAQESKIWTITQDQNSYRTRTMDKYLHLQTLPKRPHWEKVIRTANYVLTHCPPLEPFRSKLEASYTQLRTLTQSMRSI